MAQPFTLYKLIVLYMLDNSQSPLTNSQISDFILEKEYTNYFHLQQTLSELIDSSLIESHTRQNASYYTMTEKGRTTLHFFCDEISSEIKDEIQKFLKKIGTELQTKPVILADSYKTDHSDYCVRLQLKERGASLMDMTLLVPTQEAASEACSHWKGKAQDLYAQILEALI